MATDTPARREKQRELAALREKQAGLERQIMDLENELEVGKSDWRERENYFTYSATTGFFLGMVGAIASLLFNVVGSIAVGQHPLRLIQVYLTFGIGERAIRENMNDSLTLLLGCCLYIATGMVYGIGFQLILSRLAPKSDLLGRLMWACTLGIALWIVNYYLILSWLQPLLFGGHWIVSEVPWYVGAATHLVFAWTMALVYPYGVFIPYRVQSEQT